MTGGLESTAEPGVIAEGEPLTIVCGPAQLDDPIDLVATMARGANHYMLSDVPSEVPEALRNGSARSTSERFSSGSASSSRTRRSDSSNARPA